VDEVLDLALERHPQPLSDEAFADGLSATRDEKSPNEDRIKAH
jgi:hypothetical protein